MRILLTPNADYDLVVLSLAVKNRMRTEIINSVSACAKMTPYKIQFNITDTIKPSDIRIRDYKLSMRMIRDPDAIKILECAINPKILIKYLLRCYAFGIGKPHYGMINSFFLYKPIFDEEYDEQPLPQSSVHFQTDKQSDQSKAFSADDNKNTILKLMGLGGKLK